MVFQNEWYGRFPIENKIKKEHEQLVVLCAVGFSWNHIVHDFKFIVLKKGSSNKSLGF